MASQWVISQWERLAKRERQIMEIVYARKGATAKQVWGALGDPPLAYGGAGTSVDLAGKGCLTGKKRGARVCPSAHPFPKPGSQLSVAAGVGHVFRGLCG